jgi:hypothetical protein
MPGDAATDARRPRPAARVLRDERWTPSWRAAALGAAWLLLFLAQLLSPSRALANRDVLLFHLPLLTTLRRLAAAGLPVWNHWLNGGQPVLSNPSYAAFYPPTWLGLALPPAYALGLLVVLHAAIAFAGAWRLARRLGAGSGAATLAAMGYSGGGALLSLVSALNLFRSMAWFPWVLAWGDAALRPSGRGGWLLPALACGSALALQLLNGEPAMVVVSVLALSSFAFSAAMAAARSRRLASQQRADEIGAPLRSAPMPAGSPAAAALRLLAPLLVAAALAAVQLLPAAARLAGSPRSGGLPAQQATIWSAPPERLIELVFPRFFGDPTRDEEGLFFGWRLHDRDFPYVVSIYPGLLMTVLGISALAAWPVPRRSAWALSLVAGAFLALGRHNPLYELLRQAVPPLALLRFPEKFAVLAAAALTFAGALGWQRLADERAAGRPQAAELPLALSLVLAATAALLTLLLYASPAAALSLIRDHGSPLAGPGAPARGLAYLRAEAWAALATAAAVAALFAFCRSRRLARLARLDRSGRLEPGRLAILAVGLLGVDLWHYGHGLVRTLPAAEVRTPPRLASQVQAGSRVWVEPSPDGLPVIRRAGDPGADLSRALLSRLQPYSGVLWGIPYALNGDYDLMLTHWGTLALTILQADWRQQRGMALRFLGAWDVGTLLLPKRPETWAAEAARDPAAPPLRAAANPYRLASYRFVPSASFHTSYAAALSAARREGYAVDRREHCWRPGGREETVTYAAPPRLLALADDGGRIRLRYRAASRAFFTVAMTFDEGWRATVDGAPRPAYPTALCQLGLELPPGDHQLLLVYRDPLLPLAATLTLASLAGVAALATVARRRAASP